MTERKIQVMHKRFGTCTGLLCRDCCHLITGKYRDRKYCKCELYGMSHSEASDWKLANIACGMYNMPVELDQWVPVLRQITNSPKVAPPLDGQVKMEGLI